MNHPYNHRRLAEICFLSVLALGTLTTAGSLRALSQSAAPTAAPAIPTTTVADTVFRADGTPASGTVTLNWPAFTTANGANVTAGTTTVTLGQGGALSVALVPNSGSTPMGSYYTAIFHLDDGSVVRQYWVVPASTYGVKLAAIESDVVPSSVAMQTASKSYVDTAIAAAVSGHPLDSSPYVLKTGDTMTGPLQLPADPTSPLQAADKNYVDTQISGVAAGLNTKVSTLPQATQTVAQPTGTTLAVNNLNGTEQASQYVSGGGGNGIANAAATPDCASGCAIHAEPAYNSNETPYPTTWNNGTQLVDQRDGEIKESFINPTNTLRGGVSLGHSMDLISTEQAYDIRQATGEDEQFSTTLAVSNEGLTGGSNEYPKHIQGQVPYFKSTYNALQLNGTYNTPGQHILMTAQQNCYSVGDCLFGGYFMTSDGGFRDDADEGSHPFDFEDVEDTQVFQGTCQNGCTTGSTTVQVNITSGAGTQGEGRFLMDKNPAVVISTGQIVGGNQNGLATPVAEFSGTNFPVSTFLQTAQAVTSQATSIHPGTVTVPLETSGVPQGFSSSTAALPATTGVACVIDPAASDGRPVNFETAAYSVVDGSHLQLTLKRPHANGATVSVGGLCGYGLEQTVDTLQGIRQVFPVVGADSPTEVLYAGAQSAYVGVPYRQSGYANFSLALSNLSRSNGVVTANYLGGAAFDFNGLPLTISGVTDPSYNGTFTVNTVTGNTLTYTNAGPDSTSTGGTGSYTTGTYALYPMAEVTGVFNQGTRSVDGQLTLAANTIPFAPGDALELPHYHQQIIQGGTQYYTQYIPRPSNAASTGIQYDGNVSTGLTGWLIRNDQSPAFYYGAGGTHVAPNIGIQVAGAWQSALDLQAGETSALHVHCNVKGCGRWSSNYDLFQLDSNNGVDRINYNPQNSSLSFYFGNAGYGFTPYGFNAQTVNVNNLNAHNINGTVTGFVQPAALPLFGPSGSAHAQGAVPDPGATAGTTRFLREDGTWSAATTNNTQLASGLGYVLNVVNQQLGTPANLFNPAAVTTGALNTNGTVDTTVTFTAVTDFLPCAGASSFIANQAIGGGNGGTGTVFFFADGSVAGSIAGTIAANTATPIPAGAVSFRTMYFPNNTNPGSLGIWLGSTVPATVAPYGFQNQLTAQLATKVSAAQLNTSVAAVQGSVLNLLGTANINRFDSSSVTPNALVNSGNGQLEPYSGYSTSNFIPIAGFSSFVTNTGLGASGWAFYDVSGNFLSGVSGSSVAAGAPVSIPSGAYSVRITVPSGQATTAMVYGGTTLPATYTAFGYNVPNAIASAVSGSNLNVASSAWRGKTLCAMSDSLFAVGQIPQLEAPLLGMTLGMVDLQVGRTTQNLFSNFSGSTASAAENGSVPAGTNTNVAPGTTLGAAVAGCDVLQVELNANNSDSGPVSASAPNGTNWGSYTDTSAAPTLAGFIRADVEALQALNPRMRIIWVGPYTLPAYTPNTNSSSGTQYYPNGGQAQQAALTKQVLADYGIPYIDMRNAGMNPPRGNSPGNYVDASGNSLFGLANNNPHPSAFGAKQLLAPFVVREMQRFGPN